MSQSKGASPAGSTEQKGLRLFFHVNDYEPEQLPSGDKALGETSFGRLRNLMAFSDPLVVWSPSSSLMRRSPLWGEDGMRMFLDLVGKGAVQVAGRGSWLRNEDLRKSHRWEHAKWIDWFDEQVKDMIAAPGTPPEKATVLAAPEDRAREWADHWLFDDRRHRRFERVDRLVRSGEVPAGTKERTKGLTDARRRAIEVVRDAYNHLEAARICGSDVEALSDEARFYGLMEDVRTELEPNAEPKARLDAVGPETLTLIEAVHLILDGLRATTKPDDKFRKYMLDSQAHRELAQWTRRMRDEASTDRSCRHPLASEQWSDRLISDLRAGLQPPSSISGRKRATEVGVNAASTAGTVLGATVAPPLALGLAAAAYGWITLGKGLVRDAGFLPLGTASPRWVYMYAFGRMPKRAEIEQIHRALDIILGKSHPSLSVADHPTMTWGD